MTGGNPRAPYACRCFQNCLYPQCEVTYVVRRHCKSSFLTEGKLGNTWHERLDISKSSKSRTDDVWRTFVPSFDDLADADLRNEWTIPIF